MRIMGTRKLLFELRFILLRNGDMESSRLNPHSTLSNFTNQLCSVVIFTYRNIFGTQAPTQLQMPTRIKLWQNQPWLKHKRHSIYIFGCGSSFMLKYIAQHAGRLDQNG